MMQRLVKRVVISLVALVFSVCATQAKGVADHVILVVWDGMRPDFISPELTPTLWQLRTNGVWFAKHHSVYPTSTKVNCAALATGLFPEHNGIIANSEFRPEIDAKAPFSTDNLKQVRKGDRIYKGNYLGGPTLAELLQKQGMPTAIAGTKEVVLLQDRAHRAESSEGNLILFRDETLPASLWSRFVDRLGASPESNPPNALRDEWTTRSLVDVMWGKSLPPYSILWLSEPDLTQHKFGPGTPEALESIRGSDRNLAILLKALDERGVRDQTDIIVISDHGFSTITANADVKRALKGANLSVIEEFKEAPKQGDIMMVNLGGSALLYVTGNASNVIENAVRALQHERTTGVIFTRSGIAGTFPLHEARIDAPHAPDIVVSFNWAPGAVGGTPGKLARAGNANWKTGGGTHTSLSPFDTHNICVATGPDFKRGVTNSFASGNVDIMPTISWILGVTPTQKVDGRVLLESLSNAGVAKPASTTKALRASTGLKEGEWSQYLKISEVDGVRYLDEGGGEFRPKTAR